MLWQWVFIYTLEPIISFDYLLFSKSFHISHHSFWCLMQYNKKKMVCSSWKIKHLKLQVIFQWIVHFCLQKLQSIAMFHLSISKEKMNGKSRIQIFCISLRQIIKVNLFLFRCEGGVVRGKDLEIKTTTKMFKKRKPSSLKQRL